MMNTRVESTRSLNDVLSMLKDKVKSDINVATLAYFQEFKQAYNDELGYAIIRVKPFPVNVEQNEYSIYAYSFNNSNYQVGDKVMIVFCDKNFISNLSLKNKQILKVDDALHQQNYGIVVNIGSSGKSSQYEKVVIPANSNFPHVAQIDIINETSNFVASPEPSSMEEAIENKIYVTEQGNKTITFTGDASPIRDITFNVTVL